VREVFPRPTFFPARSHSSIFDSQEIVFCEGRLQILFLLCRPPPNCYALPLGRPDSCLILFSGLSTSLALFISPKRVEGRFRTFFFPRQGRQQDFRSVSSFLCRTPACFFLDSKLDQSPVSLFLLLVSAASCHHHAHFDFLLLIVMCATSPDSSSFRNNGAPITAPSVVLPWIRLRFNAVFLSHDTPHGGLVS